MVGKDRSGFHVVSCFGVQYAETQYDYHVSWQFQAYELTDCRSFTE